MQSNMTVALAGNPNCGKTTMFNALTGGRQRVGNYPGITVEKREGTVAHGDVRMNVIDLPGTYSLTAYSPEELVARDFLVEERPQVVVNILDATSLERNLYLSVQFMELGIPMVLALNMMDEVRKKGRVIDPDKLSSLLNIPVVQTVARTGEGKESLLQESIGYARKRSGSWEPLRISYGSDLDPALDEMEAVIKKTGFMAGRYPARWLALKYLEGDEQITELAENSGSAGVELARIFKQASDHCRATLDTAPEAIIADYRYGYIASIVKQGVVTITSPQDRIDFSDKLDKVLTQRLAGPAIMVSVLYGIFYLTFTVGEIPMGWLETLFGWVGDTATRLIPEGLLQSLVVSGIIDGVGGVLGFVPLIMVMFMMITFLEDSGYMARMAYMLDRVFRIFGLHGSSVMPFIVSGGIPGGCAVPGVMAARTLRSPKEKLATILTAPFMNCGAKVPVFILLTGAFFGKHAAMALFAITVFGWIMALFTAKLLRSTVIKGESTPFVMELPPYRLPTLKGVLIHTWERAWQYIKKAGTTILAVSIVIWASMTFPGLPQDQVDGFAGERATVEAKIASAQDDTTKASFEEELSVIDNKEAQTALRHSFAGKLGTAMEPVSKLAGFDWRTNIALIGGFAAKEVIVSALGTAYSMGEVDAEESEGLSETLSKDPQWNVFTAVSLMVFVLLYAPCFVTVVVLARESSWKWAGFSVVFNTVLAFSLSVAVYQIGQMFLS